jgi:hypothetical protein
MRCFLSLVLTLILGVAGQAQQPAPPGNVPAAQGDPAAATATQVAEQRGATFPMVVGIIGVGLVLFVVCYPSRRYG